MMTYQEYVENLGTIKAKKASPSEGLVMTPVSSSAIRAVGHDPDSDTLVIEFTSGDTYYYDGVSRDVHDELLKADSPGRHFQANIRGQYPHTKVGKMANCPGASEPPETEIPENTDPEAVLRQAYDRFDTEEAA